MDNLSDHRATETQRVFGSLTIPRGICLSLVIVVPFFAFFVCTRAFASEVIQKNIEYKTVAGDYGVIISGKVGMDWGQIAKENSLDPGAPLSRGQVLKVKFMRIVPETMEDGIIINIPDRTLYRFEGGRLKDYYFIAAGKPTWQTPLGDFVIKAKAKDPTWYVPPSIQKEMEEEGKDVLIEVPPGAENPLGKYWLQLSIKGVGLHGTNAPQSIYKFRSHGCMRLRPEVAELLYKEVPVGTPGKILYKPVKMAKTKDGRILLEVYRDFYKTGLKYPDEVTRMLKELDAADRVDWSKIEEAIRKRDGLVRDVSK
jgi:L,D-transpeptidase ErfK/SrfK